MRRKSAKDSLATKNTAELGLNRARKYARANLEAELHTERSHGDLRNYKPLVGIQKDQSPSEQGRKEKAESKKQGKKQKKGKGSQSTKTATKSGASDLAKHKSAIEEAASKKKRKAPDSFVAPKQLVAKVWNKAVVVVFWFRPFNLLRYLGISIISRYIVAEFLFSFFISFTFFFFIFLVNALLLVARKYAGEGLPLWAILRLIYYNIPTNVNLSLPFSVLVGALMAIGHFGASNQMLAFRFCSVRRASILRPLIVCGIFASIVSFIFSDYFLPLGRINTQKTILQLLSNNPKVIITPYSVRSFRSGNGRNTYIISGPVDGDSISELFIVDYDDDANRRIFFAKEARLAKDRPTGVIPFLLDDVNTTIASNLTPEKYSFMQADSLSYNVLLADVTETYSLTPDDRQSWEIIRIMRQQEAESGESQQLYEARSIESQLHFRSVYKGYYQTSDSTLTPKQIEAAQNSLLRSSYSGQANQMLSYRLALYLRFAVPFSCIPFMILAFSLGSMAKRYGRSIGFLLGLLLSGIFWFSIFGARLLATNNAGIPPFLLMFASNIIFLILGIFLILRQRN